MRIGLNLLYVIPGVVGGTETYAQGLLEGLAELGGENEYVVYVSREARDWVPALPAAFRTRRCGLTARRRAARYAYEQLVLPRLVRGDRLDVLHSLGYVMPLLAPCRTVVTVPDVNFREFADTMPWSRRVVLDTLVRASVARADRVVAISEFTRQELRRHLGVSPDRVDVTHLAARPPDPAEPGRDTPLPAALTGPYFVAFSSVFPHKNIPGLLLAFARARRELGLRHDLAIVGHLPAGMPPGQEGVHAFGYLTLAERNRVLHDADGLVFPSTYEGFGLPLLEAMVRGVPVASSSAGSLPEVAGDAALLFDPRDEGDMARALVRLAEPEVSRRLRVEGPLRAAQFTWRATAERTLEVYRRTGC